jgi:hypothetical protein
LIYFHSKKNTHQSQLVEKHILKKKTWISKRNVKIIKMSSKS